MDAQPGTSQHKDLDLVFDLGASTLLRREILKGCRERGWRPLDLSITREISLDDLQPQLAIVRAEPWSRLCKGLLAGGCHIVRLTVRPTQQDGILPTVQSDLIAEAGLAAEHFAERGFRTLATAFYGKMWPEDKAFLERAQELGCRAEALDFGPPSVQYSQEQFEKEYAVFDRWFARIKGPVGILARSDERALRLSYMCIRLGIRVPDTVAILGRGDDSDLCEFAPTRISSIRLNKKGRIQIAMELLDEMLAGKTPTLEPILTPPLGITTRQSTDIMTSQDPDVARALRFIWDNYGDPNLNVDAVVESVGCSRRKLEGLFRQEMGQGINEAVVTRRVKRSRDLLAHTDMKISAICNQVGLQSTRSLQRAFSRMYGLSPQKFRAEERGKGVGKDSGSR